MKYFKIIATICFFSILKTYAQSNLGNIPLPTTPEAYSISKITPFSMDYSTGKANVSIPIYNITSNGVSIPISLSYNTGGIKLNEVSSTVGLGWSLNIPGNISQSILGLDDFLGKLYNNDLNKYDEFGNFVSWEEQYTQQRNDIDAILNGIYDTKIDMFNFSLPTKSGSFILDSNKNGLPIPYDNIKIKTENSLINIIDDQGVLYKFGINSHSYSLNPNSQKRTITNRNYKLKTIVNKFNENGQHISQGDINFEYGKINSYSERNIIETANLVDNENPEHGWVPNTRVQKYLRDEGSSDYTDNLITKIIFTSGSVHFLYSDDEGLNTVGEEKYRKDINTEKGVALRKIRVLDNFGNIIKEIELNYSYFISVGSSQNFENYRLRLDNVTDLKEETSYKLVYNLDNPFPSRNSNNSDYWGYINNNTNTEHGTSIPIVYSLDSYEFFSNDVDIMKRDLSSNLSFAKTGSLKKIIYPTGGSREFFYSLPKSNSKITSTIGYRNIYYPIFSYSTEDTELDNYGEIIIPIEGINELVNQGGYDIKFNFGLSSGNCYVGEQGDQETIPNNGERYSNCSGFITLNGVPFPTQQVNGAAFDFTVNPPSNGLGNHWMLSKIGDCYCSMSGTLVAKVPTPSSEESFYYSSLIVSEIKDTDENNISYSTYFDYKNNDSNNAVLQQYTTYSGTQKNFQRLMVDGVQMDDRIGSYFKLMNSSQSGSAYSSGSIVNFREVKETNKNGSILREFSVFKESGDYNSWNNNLLKREIYFNKNNDTIKKVVHKYNFNRLKNRLSTYKVNTINSENFVGYGLDLNIIKGAKQILMSTDTGGIDGDIYYIEDKKAQYIESGYIENVETEIFEYINGNVLKTINTTEFGNYSDVNKPILPSKNEVIYPNGNSVSTKFEYSDNKNSFLYNHNFVSTPLLTENRINDQLVSRSETVFPTSKDEAISQIANASNNYVINPSYSQTELNDIGDFEVDITYDKYDSKGNILQYTTKNLTTVIIWGYNNTQPIAKIEGATYDEVKNAAVSIISASDLDGQLNKNNDESSLINALTNFRKQFPNAMVTTYTYDPLIGVRSITGPNGMTEFYIYDEANRLKEVRDINNNILKENKYNYKN